MKIYLFFLLGFVSFGVGRAETLPAAVTKVLDSYNVVWDSPSKDSSDSMPCGGHDVGLNVWVENGDLLFYMSRSGTFDENNSMLKLGRVRIKMTPNPFATGGTFRQELKLKEGYIEITGKSGAALATVKLWVEVGRPVVHVDVHGEQPLQVETWYESWRTTERSLNRNERAQCFSFAGTTPEQMPVKTHVDTFEPSPGQVLWYHRNDNTDLLFDKLVNYEHLDSVKDKMMNPMKDLTFGGLMKGDGFVSIDAPIQGTYASVPFTAWGLKSQKAQADQSVRIYFHTEQAATIDLWKQHLAALSDATDVSNDAARQKALSWWGDFWDRSHIFINPDKPNPQDAGWVVGKNYQLFRYTLGCNAYGDYPSKFNGSLFTVDARDSTPDYRTWGGGSFTAQNQRLVYWPMLKSGDFDMMKPQFDYYKRSLPNAELVTQVYWGHAGACFTEQLENFGLVTGRGYGNAWGKDGPGPRAGDDISTIQVIQIRDLYDTVFEFCDMILQTPSYSGNDITEYLPLVKSCVTFFDEHYRAENKKVTGHELDANGHLILPSTGAESFKEAKNPANIIAALHTVLTHLLALPANYGTADDRKNWERILKSLPPIPTMDLDGHKVIAPAESYKARGQEFTAMYPVFPWHIYGLGRPDLRLAIDTWQYEPDKNRKSPKGWKQAGIWTADLGLTDEATAILSQKLADAKPRFPTFWGPNFDYTPDFNAAGSAAIGLEEMLLQTNGDKIYLAPTWPKTWTADFKLHAPRQTTIEAVIRHGACESKKVVPESRAADVSCGPPAAVPLIIA